MLRLPSVMLLALAAGISGGVAGTASAAGSGSNAPDTAQVAPAAPVHAKAPMHARAKVAPVDRVDARINDLHRKLKITPAQEGQWTSVAQIMRDNAAQIKPLIEDRAKAKQTVTSIDDLRSYEAIVDSQANGLKKFVPAFEALYGTLSDSQKHAADAEFTRFQPPASRPAHKAPAKS